MPSLPANLLTDLPESAASELTDVLVNSSGVRIERIVSTGQSSPKDFWYDQDEDEWVVVLQGESKLQFDDGTRVDLSPGDHVLIPAHKKHRVEWTSPKQPTVWLAVFYHATKA